MFDSRVSNAIRPPAPRRLASVWGIVFLLGLAARAVAGDRACPLDGTPLAAPGSVHWNVAGGADSDGCRYSVDEAGRMTVVGLDLLLRCSKEGCAMALLPRHAGLTLSGDEGTKLREALARVEQGSSAVTRWERAAVAVRTLASKTHEPAATLAGEHFLRAAWAARGEAVLLRPDAGYRPRDIAEAVALLASLEKRLEGDPRQSPAIRRLDSLLADLEDTRARLAPLSRGQSVVARRSLLESQARLARVERRLLAQKYDLLEKRLSPSFQGLSDQQLREALARAWIRYGEPGRYEPLLRALEKDDSERVGLMRQALSQERRLLGLAEAAFREASVSASGAEKARTLFLVGECVRRQGGSGWRALLAQARELAPESPAGRAAKQLLRGDQ